MDDSTILQYPTMCPYLIVDDGPAAIDFYTTVLGATERMRLPTPDGSIMHAEIAFGDSVVMLANAFPEMGFHDPKQIGGTPVSLMIYVADCDAAYETALAAGATSQQEPQDQPYGDRMARIQDPFGHIWSLATQVKRMTIGEVRKSLEGFGESD